MKFTIIIPAYNSSSFIHIPLDSLERQTYNKPYQVIIIDDGSIDNLKQTVSPYLKRNASGEYIRKTNGNGGSVINYAKLNNLIKGEYVTILDSDDYFKESMLTRVSRHSDDVIITGIAKKEKNKEKHMPIYFKRRSGIIKKCRSFTPISTPHGKFYKSKLFMKLINLREGVPYQDTILFTDLISKATSINFIRQDLAIGWRDREGNSTTQVGNQKRTTLWLETCAALVSLPSVHNEANSWALMYLGELGRNYKGVIPFKIEINTSQAKFKGLPFGVRNIAKLYFIIKTKKFRK